MRSCVQRSLQMLATGFLTESKVCSWGPFVFKFITFGVPAEDMTVDCARAEKYASPKV